MTDEQKNAAPSLPPADVAAAVKQAIEQPPKQRPKLELKPCPCGATPEGLYIEMPERGKYGLASPQCCSVWTVEFRNGFEGNQEITLQKAAKAWNDAPRATA